MTARARWLAGLERTAQDRLSPALFEYVAQGARDGVTAAAATLAWREHRFAPRVLEDVTEVTTEVGLLGRTHALPFGIAPTTLRNAVHPDGELAVARAAAAAGSLLVVSSNAGSPFAAIGDTGVHWWLQAYLPADRELAVPLLRRAVDAGAAGIVLTVDTPVVGTKYHAGTPVWEEIDAGSLRVNFGPGYEEAPRSEKATDLRPADIDRLAAGTGLPVVVKGVLRADDAARCVEAGAAAVWVSNHGGRQLDRTVATARALPGVVAAVGDRVPVLVDGGLRDGLDIATALALGASYCLLGRSPLYALTEGEDGVSALYDELREQLVETLRLAGAADVRGLRGALVNGL